MTSPVRVLAALALAGALAGCRSHVQPKVAALPTPLDKHTAAGAQATAQAGLAAVPVPPGATSRTTPPISTVELGGPQASTRADALRTWVVPLTRDAAFAWYVAHLPALAGQQEETVGPQDKVFLAYDQTVGLDKPQTQIAISPQGDHASVLIDSLVLWTPEKAPLQTIPADVTTATFDFVRPVFEQDEIHPGATPAHTRTIIKGAKVDRALTPSEVAEVRAFINAEPTDLQDNPQMPSSCAPGYESATLTFYYGGATEVFAVALQGCGRIEPTINGVAAPYTRGGNEFAGPLRKLAGLAPGDPRGQPT